MPNKKNVLLILLVLAATLAILSVRLLNNIGTATPQSPLAFMDARWGMTADEVAAANQVSLSPAQTNKRFFSPKQGEEGRFQVLAAQGHRFLDRDADVYYTFKDGKLCMMHVFISDKDLDVLDADMRRHLNRVWGPEASEMTDEGPLKQVWQTKDMNVNYWFYEDELALNNRFKAGVGVTYKPIEES